MNLAVNQRLKSGITSLTSQSVFVYAAVLAILLLGTGLRLFRLGEWSFWIDEMYTVNRAVNLYSTPQLFLENIPPARNWFPLSVILTAQIFNAFGISETNARVVPALIGILSVPVFFILVRRIFSTRIALITILLLAVSPWHLEWSQNARGYSTIFLFYSLALFAFYEAFEKSRPAYFLLFYLFLYLASSERLIALFVLPVLLVYLLAVKFLPYEKPAGLTLKNILILISPALLFAIYEIFSLVTSGGSIFLSIFNEIVETFVGKPIENPFTQTVFLVFKYGVPLVALGIFSAVYLLAQKTRQGLLIVSGAFIPFALVIAVTPFMFVEERYAFPSLLYWLVLAAVAVDLALARMQKLETVLALGILFVLLADSMGANIQYYHINHGNRRNWREAFSLVQNNMQPGDMVVSTWPELGRYYLKQDIILWQSVNREAIEASQNRVWFVIIPDMAWYYNTQDFLYWVERNTRMVKVLYLRTPDNTNIEVYLYDPAQKSTLTPLK